MKTLRVMFEDGWMHHIGGLDLQLRELEARVVARRGTRAAIIMMGVDVAESHEATLEHQARVVAPPWMAKIFGGTFATAATNMSWCRLPCFRSRQIPGLVLMLDEPGIIVGAIEVDT